MKTELGTGLMGEPTITLILDREEGITLATDILYYASHRTKKDWERKMTYGDEHGSIIFIVRGPEN